MGVSVVLSEMIGVRLVDTLKNQILDAVAEVTTYKSLVASSDEQLTNS